MVLLAAPLGGVQAQPASTAPAQDSAQGFPNRPLRTIVPFAPGGSTDIVGRIVSAALSEVLGQQVVVDNRGGAASTIGAEIAARATPDGYTLFPCNIASLAISPALYRKLAYNPVADFAPLGATGATPNVLVVNLALPATTVAEFVALVQAQPGKLNYSSAGVGTSPQLSMELFRTQARINIVHIPYKGGAPALADLIGGHVHGDVYQPADGDHDDPLRPGPRARCHVGAARHRSARGADHRRVRHAGLRGHFLAGHVRPRR